MFDLRKIPNSRMNVPEPEVHIAGTDITPGMALTLSDGVLRVCAPTSTPTHISMGIAETGNKTAVFAVNSAQIFDVEVVSSGTTFTLKEGQKVTITADGLGVTNTTENGVATVIALNGAQNKGDKITVRF